MASTSGTATVSDALRAYAESCSDRPPSDVDPACTTDGWVAACASGRCTIEGAVCSPGCVPDGQAGCTGPAELTCARCPDEEQHSSLRPHCCPARSRPALPVRNAAPVPRRQPARRTGKVDSFGTPDAPVRLSAHGSLGVNIARSGSTGSRTTPRLSSRRPTPIICTDTSDWSVAASRVLRSSGAGASARAPPGYRRQP